MMTGADIFRERIHPVVIYLRGIGNMVIGEIQVATAEIQGISTQMTFN